MPPVPEGLGRILSYDLSPLRPWEMANADAFTWTEAVAIQQAYRDAIADVDTEASAYQATERPPSGAVE